MADIVQVGDKCVADGAWGKCGRLSDFRSVIDHIVIDRIEHRGGNDPKNLRLYYTAYKKDGTRVTEGEPDDGNVVKCYGCYEVQDLTVIKKAVTIRNFMSNIVDTFKLLITAEPQRTFIKAGIVDEKGNFTKEGEELFLQYLLSQHGADFKTTVVDAVLAEQEKSKK